MFDASQPRPQTPSVGWIKILPSFSQLDASAGDENSLKLITGLTHLHKTSSCILDLYLRSIAAISSSEVPNICTAHNAAFIAPDFPIAK